MIQGEKLIKVGQALHGYQDGHSLLATSEVLPHAAEATLFGLSDLSGPQLVAGFDEYLTGYPLPEIAAYALAKTWYAPEMPRPGCVWTHTLLLRASDIAQIQGIHTLRHYFKRPTSDPVSWMKYNEPLRVTINGANDRDDYESIPFLLELYAALYESLEDPVLLPANSSKEYESLVLRIWDQQWPRLRRFFKFCTGAIESRTLEGRPFDLQIVPFNGIVRAQRDLRDAIVIQHNSNKGEAQSWISQLVKDFLLKDADFRNFLRDFGADVAPRRSSFKKLVEAYNLQSAVNDFAQYWDALLALFPAEAEAAKLKVSAVLPAQTDLRVPDVSLTRKISVLVSSYRDSSYPKRLLDVTEFEELLDQENLPNVLQALASAPYINSFGEHLIHRIATGLLPGQLSSVATTPSALMLLLSRNPQLARFEELWSVMKGRQQQVLDLLSGSHLSQTDWDAIMSAAVQADVPQTARAFLKIMGGAAVPAALNIAQRSGVLLPSDWNAVLGEQTPSVANWLRTHPDVNITLLDFLTQDLNPSDSVLLSLGTEIWESMLKMEVTPPQRGIAFILLVGLQNPSGKPFELVAQTFELIHRAAELEQLESATWMIIRDNLPVLGSGRDWDTCERLRQLLVAKYVSYSWPVSFLYRTLQNLRTLERTILYITSEKRLRPFGRLLLSEALSGAANPAQLDLLLQFEKKLRK